MKISPKEIKHNLMFLRDLMPINQYLEICEAVNFNLAHIAHDFPEPDCGMNNPTGSMRTISILALAVLCIEAKKESIVDADYDTIVEEEYKKAALLASYVNSHNSLLKMTIRELSVCVVELYVEAWHAQGYNKLSVIPFKELPSEIQHVMDHLAKRWKVVKEEYTESFFNWPIFVA